MFRNVLRSHSTAMMAGAAAALTGGAFVSNSRTKPETTTDCSDSTVIGLLQELNLKVSNLEATIGAKKSDGLSKNFQKGGIDIVLGAQWGDEGKGKLVDMLGQVSKHRDPFIFSKDYTKSF
jgi:hypothetical protein